MPKNIYVLSDIHGHYKVFMKMLEKINFSDDDHLYILGDCCDRGPQSIEIYLYLQEHKDNIVLLKGNHEAMMRDAFLADNEKASAIRQWNRNGGRKTMENYDGYLKKEKLNDLDYNIIKSAFTKMMVDYINACPNFVELNVNHQDYVLVHAGFNPEKGLYEQNEEECLWMREYFFMSPGLKDKIVIFGHTPTCYMHNKDNCYDIWFDPVFEDKMGIDGGLGPFEDGQLNCICLNTEQTYVVRKSEMEDLV